MTDQRSQDAVTDALYDCHSEGVEWWNTQHPVGKMLWASHHRHGGGPPHLPEGPDVLRAEQELNERIAGSLTDVLCRFQGMG
jgi:hypothetical protein